METTEVIRELGAADSPFYYIAESGFFLKTKNGPGTEVPKGARLQLTDQTARELFYGRKVKMEFLRDGDVYAVIRRFTYVNQKGEYEELVPGDRLRLNVEEATELLRREQVKIEREGE